MAATRPYDVAVIGAGVIGLSTAMHVVERHPRWRVVIVEKAPHPASQQSGHNSGVIHSGIYYKPGSFKARFSVEGHRSMLRFCEENGIPFLKCGKLIVATHKEEVSRLHALFESGLANGVEGLERVGPERAREIEPHAQALEALWAPGTAIVDFRQVAETYAARIRAAGGEFRFDSRVRSVVSGAASGHFASSATARLETGTGDIEARALVNCAGLHADVIARMSGLRPSIRIIPFRGEYYALTGQRRDLVRGLIYPVPDPAYPFLGVHFTRKIGGGIEAGPNAVLATKREGYRRRDASIGDIAGMLSFPGFWRMALREWRTGLAEIYRSVHKRAFVESLQRLVPEVAAADLTPGASGVRAQAVAENGALVDDFRIERSQNAIHVLNAPSPGATSSLVIGRHITDLLDEALPPE